MIFEILRKQRYQIYKHVGVKLCGWLKKKMLYNKDCYKSKFYGIETHRCVQCTPSVIWCQQSCIFCWRVLPRDLDIDEFPSPEWEKSEVVAEKILELHKKAIMGYKGILDRVGEKKFEEALNPKHIALSLSGEPTLYPYIDELIDIFKDKGFTTFLVSNGILTEVIKKIKPTQLYISLDAYDLESYKKICRGKEEFWEHILETLNILDKKERSCIRTTLVRNYNTNIEKFIPLYELANVDFIELKSYMHVGYSQRRLKKEHMLSYDEILKLAKKVEENSRYKIADGCEESRVVLLVNKDKDVSVKI
ncbi:4-demethylwyosine synthase TYW1 [Methanocaldococcus infernus]